MKIVPTQLDGLLLIEPTVHRDDRGFFVETYHEDRYARAGIREEWVQDNHSRSSRGTLRGLHFQIRPGQPKLVRVDRGAIFDVVVDIRHGSSNFGKWEAFELDDDLHRQLYVPVGFAHGFCALSDLADVSYKVGSHYDAANEQGIAWDDPEIGIAWPIESPIISARDQANPPLSAIASTLSDWTRR